ncbi:MAG: tetratricopeptide repeat protein, partial [Candidatus Binatia bacterium]
MTRTKSFVWLSLVLLLFGAASCQVAGQVQSGRQALLLRNDPEEALSHLQRAAESDPNYAMQVGPFRESVWTYIGRAHYQAGRLPEARKALERALAQDGNDHLARIYLGLTLAKSGDRSTGLKEIQRGMKGLYDWLEYVGYHSYYGRYWDPNREVRGQIEKYLATISRKEFDWQKLIASAEWLGKRME